MRHTYLHRLRLLLPALTWLFIQFAMTGVMIGSSADANQIEICSPFGIQQISINPETGEPVEPVVGGKGCDWCQSFGLIVDTAERGAVDWRAVACEYQDKLVRSPAPYTPLRLVADNQSRAPPTL